MGQAHHRPHRPDLSGGNGGEHHRPRRLPGLPARFPRAHGRSARRRRTRRGGRGGVRLFRGDHRRRGDECRRRGPRRRRSVPRHTGEYDPVPGGHVVAVPLLPSGQRHGNQRVPVQHLAADRRPPAHHARQPHRARHRPGDAPPRHPRPSPHHDPHLGIRRHRHLHDRRRLGPRRGELPRPRQRRGGHGRLLPRLLPHGCSDSRRVCRRTSPSPRSRSSPRSPRPSCSGCRWATTTSPGWRPWRPACSSRGSSSSPARPRRTRRHRPPADRHRRHPDPWRTPTIGTPRHRRPPPTASIHFPPDASGRDPTDPAQTDSSGPDRSDREPTTPLESDSSHPDALSGLQSPSDPVP